MAGFNLMMYIKYQNAMQTRESDPDETIRRLQEIRQEAIENNDNEWRLIADHWLTQTYLNWKKDYTVANKLAVEAAVEYRKPQYEPYREYICVQNDLMLVYNGIDPVGYAKQIKEAIDLTIDMTTPDMACHYCLNRDLISYHKFTGDDTTAREQAAKLFAITSQQQHYRIQAYEHLCYFAYEDRAWDDLLALSQQGLALAGEDDKLMQWITLKCYEMMALYRLGQEGNATKAYDIIQYRVGTLKMVQGYDYYRLMTVYQEAQGNLQSALEFTNTYIQTLENTGRPYWECKARLEQIRLLKAAGEPAGDAISIFKATTQKLNATTQFDSDLAEILGEA